MRVCGTGLGGGVGVGVAYMGTCVVVGWAVGWCCRRAARIGVGWHVGREVFPSIIKTTNFAALSS